MGEINWEEEAIFYMEKLSTNCKQSNWDNEYIELEWCYGSNSQRFQKHLNKDNHFILLHQ